MIHPVEYLDLDDLINLASRLLGTKLTIRDIGLLGSAAARPQTTLFGEDVYPDLWTKAAGLLHSIVKDHALVDGNKRLGWLACGVPGDQRRHRDHDPERRRLRFVMDVTTGNHEIDELAAALRHLLR